MKEIWERIENWLRENYPEGLSKLNDGASAELIQATERFLGVEFPDEVRDSFRIHNGERRYIGLLNGWELLSLEEIRSQWAVWKELLDDGEFESHKSDPETGIRDDWWHPNWIPLTHDGGGDHDCLDLAPTGEGNVGQIIKMYHDDESRSLEASGFRNWLSNLADELEAGLYQYTDNYGISKGD